MSNRPWYFVIFSLAVTSSAACKDTWASTLSGEFKLVSAMAAWDALLEGLENIEVKLRSRVRVR